jgi:tetratricopeptide (TPR) repeat protein
MSYIRIPKTARRIAIDNVAIGNLYDIYSYLDIKDLRQIAAVSKSFNNTTTEHMRAFSPEKIVDVTDKLIANGNIINAERYIRNYITIGKKTPNIILNRYMTLITHTIWNRNKYQDVRSNIYSHFRRNATKELGWLVSSMNQTMHHKQTIFFPYDLYRNNIHASCGVIRTSRNHRRLDSEQLSGPDIKTIVLCNKVNIENHDGTSYFSNNPDCDLLCIYAYICYLDGRYVLALKILDNINGIDPNSPIKYVLNSVLSHNKIEYCKLRYQEIFRNLYMCIKIFPNFAHSYYLMGHLVYNNYAHVSQLLFKKCISIDN